MNIKVLFGIVILALLVAACTPTGEVVKEKEPAPIKIGVIIPLTGSSSYLGQYIKEGLELAKDEINRNGGVNNRRLELIYEDSQADTKTGISAYQKLTQIDNVKITIAALSHVTLGIAPLAEKDKVIVLSVAGAAPTISEAGDYIFRHNLLPQEEVKMLADFIYNKQKITKIGIMAVSTESGVSWANEFKTEYEKLGGKIVIMEMYAKDEKDFRTYLFKLKEAGVKAALNGGYPDQAGMTMKQSKESGLNFTWFATYAVETPKYLEVAGEAGDGIIYTHFMNPEDPVFKEYDARFNAVYSKSSDPYAALAYDALKIIAQAFEECSAKEDTECIKQKLYGTQDYQGVTGKIGFDKNGDTHKALIIKTVKNGEFVIY